MEQTVLLQSAGQYVSGLPEGTDPLESAWGMPTFAPGEKGLVSKTIDFYKNYWGTIGDILTGDRESLKERDTVVKIGEENEALSPGLVMFFVVGLGALYYFKRKGR